MLSKSDRGSCVSSCGAEKRPVMFFTVCYRSQQSFNDCFLSDSNQPKPARSRLVHLHALALLFRKNRQPLGKGEGRGRSQFLGPHR